MKFILTSLFVVSLVAFLVTAKEAKASPRGMKLVCYSRNSVESSYRFDIVGGWLNRTATGYMLTPESPNKAKTLNCSPRLGATDEELLGTIMDLGHSKPLWTCRVPAGSSPYYLVSVQESAENAVRAYVIRDQVPTDEDEDGGQSDLAAILSCAVSNN